MKPFRDNINLQTISVGRGETRQTMHLSCFEGYTGARVRYPSSHYEQAFSINVINAIQGWQIEQNFFSKAVRRNWCSGVQAVIPLPHLVPPFFYAFSNRWLIQSSLNRLKPSGCVQVFLFFPNVCFLPSQFSHSPESFYGKLKARNYSNVANGALN